MSNGSTPKRRTRVESVLLDRGVVTEEILASARQRQMGAKRPLVEVLLEQEAVDEDRLVEALATVTSMKVVPGEALRPNPDIQHLVPAETAQRLGILPLSVSGDELVVATGDPFQVQAFDEIASLTNHRVRPVFAKPSEVREALRSTRKGEEDLDDLLKNANDADEAVIIQAADEEEPLSDDEMDLSISPDDAPMIRLLNLIISDGIRQGASDIHIEAERDGVRVRFRIDGELREVLTLPESARARLLARLKIVANLSIIETRKPQDGRAKAALNDRLYDLRVSTIPSYFGEKAVLRILDSSSPSFNLDHSGIQPDVLAEWRELLHRPQGLLLLTGPTGSGKSTTLYASILELRDPRKNIVSVEDPVEYQFQGIVHVPVRSDIGMTFAAALRSVLRQDPDIVLLGEIRDQETAEVALRAAMTGHLVLSTLHTNDAVGAIARLLDLGTTPHLLASCLLGVMGQRLIRTVCDQCAQPYEYPIEELLALTVAGGLPPEVPIETRKGEGCAACNGTGMKGRSAIVELIKGTPELKKMVGDTAEEDEIRRQVVMDGMQPLVHSGLLKVLTGASSPEAVRDVAAAELRGAAPEPEKPSTAEATVPVCLECEQTLDPAWALCPFCGAAAPKGDVATALVIDDSRMDRRLVSAALRKEFPRVEEAEDGEHGLDALSRVKPDIVIVDQSMPGLSGIEVIRELRSHLETATLPVIMLTAGGPEGLEFEALDAGADDYLTKPVTPDRLRARVRSLLASRSRAMARQGAD